MGLNLSKKTARADFEAFQNVALTGGVSREFTVPRGGERPWIASLNARLEFQDYDATDPQNPTLEGDKQENTLYGVSGQLNIPMTDTVFLVNKVGYIENQSNNELDQYDDTFARIGLEFNFEAGRVDYLASGRRVSPGLVFSLL